MKFKQYFLFTKEQRIGLLLLVSLIAVTQVLYYFLDFSSKTTVSNEESQWLAIQTEIDSAKSNSSEDTYKIYPFNPNFITDFKGYKLGMKVAEIDRLLAYRKFNKFINSAKEFQAVTKISDSLLAAISPNFKFPDWVKNKNLQFKNTKFENFKTKDAAAVKDINIATKEDLMNIYGIGEAISDRILKQKELLGAFVNMNQMEDIWGLSPEVILQLNKHFKIATSTTVKKIDINNLSVRDLSKFPYFKYAIAKEIVMFRSMNNGIKDTDDLTKIKDFPIDKLNIIALYLNFK